MANSYSMDDLLEFLDHAGNRGLIPAATAQALAVASRNILGVLSEQERADLGALDSASIIKRFNNKRAKDFNPSSLKEYGRRLNRALELFLRWREDPAGFTVKTRTSSTAKKKESPQAGSEAGSGWRESTASVPAAPGTYQSSIPVRPGVVITLLNIPHDLKKSEADRISAFVKMLAVDGPN